jgi:alkyl sulfatase BDS1-like metallo-beta-lactamase superfamily hydrolase
LESKLVSSPGNKISITRRSRAKIGETFIELAGGMDKLDARARSAFAEKKYNLSAKLLSYAIAAKPENKEEKQLKPDALRKMAYTTKSGIQVRNVRLDS